MSKFEGSSNSGEYSESLDLPESQGAQVVRPGESFVFAEPASTELPITDRSALDLTPEDANFDIPKGSEVQHPVVAAIQDLADAVHRANDTDSFHRPISIDEVGSPFGESPVGDAPARGIFQGTTLQGNIFDGTPLEGKMEIPEMNIPPMDIPEFRPGGEQ